MSEQANGPGTVARRAVAQYRQEQVNSLSQKELLLMLYEGAIRFCEEAGQAIARKDYNTSYERLTRARDIVSELLAILNPDIEADVVANLRRLYDFCIYGITEVNLTKDSAMLDAVMQVLHTLRSAWVEVDFEAAVVELREAFAEEQSARSETPAAAPARHRPAPQGEPKSISLTA